MTEANTWAVGDGDRLRIDYQHVFLGTIDVGADSAEFVPASAVEIIVTQLENRQGCESRRERDAPDSHCTEEWEHADLFTFEVADAPTAVNPGRGSGPPLSAPASDDLKAAPGATR